MVMSRDSDNDFNGMECLSGEIWEFSTETRLKLIWLGQGESKLGVQYTQRELLGSIDGIHVTRSNRGSVSSFKIICAIQMQSPLLRACARGKVVAPVAILTFSHRRRAEGQGTILPLSPAPLLCQWSPKWNTSEAVTVAKWGLKYGLRRIWMSMTASK